MGAALDITDKITKAVHSISEVLVEDDANKTALALRELIQVAMQHHLTADDVYELIQTTGLRGRQGLRFFIQHEFRELAE